MSEKFKIGDIIQIKLHPDNIYNPVLDFFTKNQLYKFLIVDKNSQYNEIIYTLLSFENNNTYNSRLNEDSWRVIA